MNRTIQICGTQTLANCQCCGGLFGDKIYSHYEKDHAKYASESSDPDGIYLKHTFVCEDCAKEFIRVQKWWELNEPYTNTYLDTHLVTYL